MKSQESSFERYRADCHLPILAYKELFERCQESYPPLLQELGHQRSTTVNAAGTTLKESVPARQAVLSQFSKSARIQLEQAKQNETDAVDATELIKHVKGLLRA
ncbi:hypothetical protein CPC08DRAFT_253907 [Agrocybe pediades]|nr:hypothetical protein CPC08DRAFT_253907 [Agrocybe pediades]